MFDPGDSSSSNKKSDRGKALKSGLRAAGGSLSASGDRMMGDSEAEASSRIGAVQYHHGGKIRKTGPARLKKGEKVIPRGKAKRVERMMKRKKMRMTGGKR